jgi:hypothetical protein
LCDDCFKPIYTQYAGLKTAREIEAFETIIDPLIRSTKFVIPDGYIIKGHWFVLFNHGPLGLVVNYESEY